MEKELQQRHRPVHEEDDAKGPLAKKTLVEIVAEKQHKQAAIPSRDILERVLAVPRDVVVCTPPRSSSWCFLREGPAQLAPSLQTLLRRVDNVEVSVVPSSVSNAGEVTDKLFCVATWREARFPSQLISHLQWDLRMEGPTVWQQHAIASLFLGYNTLCVGPHGCGKTTLALLALVTCVAAKRSEEGVAAYGLYVSPTSELHNYAYHILRGLCRQCGVAMSNNISSEAQIVVATPTTLQRCLEERNGEIAAPCCIVVDEMDRFGIAPLCDTMKNVWRAIFQSSPDDAVAKCPQLILCGSSLERLDELWSPYVSNFVCIRQKDAAAWCGVLHYVEYVPESFRIPYIALLVQRTPPPVLVVCPNRGEMEQVVSYLANGQHGVFIKCTNNFSDFMKGDADVLVGTEASLRGLPMCQLRHVINTLVPYHSMEDAMNFRVRLFNIKARGYVPLMTTLINRTVPDGVAAELQQLLRRSGQSVPFFLQKRIVLSARGGPPHGKGGKP